MSWISFEGYPLLAPYDVRPDSISAGKRQAEYLLSAKAERVTYLRQFLAQQNELLSIETNEQCDEFQSWYESSFLGHPDLAIFEAEWKSFSLDLGLWFGDEIVRRDSSLYWGFFDPKSNRNWHGKYCLVINGYNPTDRRMVRNILNSFLSLGVNVLRNNPWVSGSFTSYFIHLSSQTMI